MIKQQVNDEDPYFELRKYYNELFLSRSTEFENKINSLKRLLNMQLLEILLILVLSIIPKLKTLISGLKILIQIKIRQFKSA